MNLRNLIRIAAALAIVALPVAVVAAPDNNSGNPNYPNNNQCVQWNNNGQCVRWNNNGNWNNGNWNNGQGNYGRHRDRDDEGDNVRCNNGNGKGHGYGRCGNGNGYGYGNGNGRWNGNQNGTLGGIVSSFSPYNLYLRNGTHVELHDGTIINPTGINLTGGQRVRVLGNWNGDGTFNANEIDVIGNGGYYRY